ncbi:MAG: pyruvate, phosphate dikinase [Betaproteobacteria bacterium]|nr:pyruvate, phosphate dikinase [Betaproteobacteria bacterium]
MNLVDPGAGGRFLFAIAPHAQMVGAEELGFKAHNLLRMARRELAVPEAFVLGTSACKTYFADRERLHRILAPTLREGLADIERASGLGFGSTRRPLLVSVRSGAPVSMPGMMDTLLDVGLCDTTLRGLLRLTGNPRLAWDSYRRLVQSFAEVVHAADPAPFRERLEQRIDEEQLASARELDYRALSELARDYLSLYADLVGKPFPQDPFEQLETAVGAVFDSWQGARAREYRRMHRIADDLGAAVTVQRMVFGNAGGTSGSGVAFTRDPTTGENRPYVDFLFNSQGEDLVSGRSAGGDADRLARVLPEVSARLAQTRHALEQEFRDAQEIEFTVQDGRLYMLQTRTAKRTAWAALRIAVEQVRKELITPADALSRLAGIDLAAIRRVRFANLDGLQALGRGIPAGLGVAAGRLALDAAAVAEFARSGRTAILVREDMSTEDIAAIESAQGVITARGSRTAHAAVVAGQLGKPCVVGLGTLSIELAARTVRFGETLLREGDELCLDAETGEVFAGRPQLAAERPDDLLAELALWQTPVAA